MYTKILVPLDGSPLSERILPYARRFAEAGHSAVELLHVIHPDTIDLLVDVGRGRLNEVVRSDLTKTSEEYLDRIARSFAQAPTPECSVEIGVPAETIIRRARAAPGTLVAMSTRGHSGLKRWLLGSVTNKVLQQIGNPLLLVAATDAVQDEGQTLTRVLVPLDGSDLAEKVLPHVAAISKALNLSVELLQFYAPPLSALVPVDYRIPPDDYAGTAMRQALHKKAEAYLQDKLPQLSAAGVKNVSFSVIEGEAAQGIIETAQNTRGNLIAMCTHGRSGIGQWVLGSTTERVLTHSGDPVLVIPASTDQA
jgi:nucleotide-binding universal stress UspA family protein